MNLSNVTNREQALELLEGYVEERKDELNQQKTHRPLVKSYMLETVAPHVSTQPTLNAVFEALGLSLIPLDDTLFKILDKNLNKTVGLLENLLARFPVIYTSDESKVMDPWVRKLVGSSPALDHLWISGRAFEELLQAVLRFSPGHRYGRLVFQYSNLFEGADSAPANPQDEESEEQEPVGPEEPSDQVFEAGDEEFVPERRATRFSVVDKLDVLKQKLPKMRELYNPLHAIAQLRFPARGPGGHDFFFHGKATNRSSSFADHRQHVRFVLQVYKRATEQTEQTAWQSQERTEISTGSQVNLLVGAPVLLRFKEALSQQTFDKFISSTFRRKDGRFRLWGNPIHLGPRKVHVYGLDRHLWQPLFLEITDRQMVVIVPEGTCGNTVHRLVTNVQQFLDPGVDVWIGDRKYSDLIRVEPDLESIYEENGQ